MNQIKFRTWHKELKMMLPVLTLEFYVNQELHEIYFDWEVVGNIYENPELLEQN
jgi:hypothetical protein